MQFCSLRSRFERHLSETKDAYRDEGRKIIKSIEFDVLIAETNSALEYKKRIFAMYGGPLVFDQILNKGLVGTPRYNTK
jgi:hypothetical protein